MDVLTDKAVSQLLGYGFPNEMSARIQQRLNEHRMLCGNPVSRQPVRIAGAGWTPRNVEQIFDRHGQATQQAVGLTFHQKRFTRNKSVPLFYIGHGLSDTKICCVFNCLTLDLEEFQGISALDQLAI